MYISSNAVMFSQGDRDHLMQLCLETVLEGYSVLVFCPSKAWCENLAEAIAKEFYKIGENKLPLLAVHQTERLTPNNF